MEYRIEKMNRMRRNIVLGVLIGTVMTLGLFILAGVCFLNHWAMYENFRLKFGTNLYNIAMLLFLISLLIFVIRYLLYKKKLLKNPALRTAVNDERVRLNWLKAFRCAFYVLIGITVFWWWFDSGFFPRTGWMGFILPDGPILILFGCFIALTASFFVYNREGEK